MKQKSNTKRQFNKNNVKYRKSKLSKKKKKVNRNLLKKSGGVENDWKTIQNGGSVNGKSDYCLWISVFQGLKNKDNFNHNWSDQLITWFRIRSYTGWKGPWDSNKNKDEEMLIQFCKEYNIIVNIYKKDVPYDYINQFSTYTPDGFILDYTSHKIKELCNKYKNLKSIYVYHTPNHFELVTQSPNILHEGNNYGVLFPNTYEGKKFKCESVPNEINMRFDSGLQHDLQEKLEKLFSKDQDKDPNSIKYTINALYLERVYNESNILVKINEDIITEQLTNRAWYLVEYISPFFINYYVDNNIWEEKNHIALDNVANIKKLFKLDTKKIDIKDIERISLLFIHLPQLYNLIAKYSINHLNGKEIQVVKTILESHEMRKFALNDFQKGEKENHWIWCVLPQPQFLSSRGHGCNLDNDYNKGWMQAVILYHNEVFRDTLHKVVNTIYGLCNKTVQGYNLEKIMGGNGDHFKLHSSLLIFNEIAKNVKSYHEESITLFTQDGNKLDTFINQSNEIIKEITNSKAKDLKELIKLWKSKVKPNIPKVVNKDVVNKNVKVVHPQPQLVKNIQELKSSAPIKREPPRRQINKRQPTYRKGMIESRKSYMRPKSNSFFTKFVGFMNKILDFDPDGAAKAI